MNKNKYLLEAFQATMLKTKRIIVTILSDKNSGCLFGFGIQKMGTCYWDRLYVCYWTVLYVMNCNSYAVEIYFRCRYDNKYLLKNRIK